jgi:hypothetical protein
MNYPNQPYPQPYQPSAPRGTRTRRNNRVILATFGGLLAFFVLAGAVGSLVQKPHHARHHSAKSTPASHSTTAPASPAAHAITPSTAQAVKSWYAGRGSVGVAAIIRAMTLLQRSGASGSFTAVGRACGTISRAVTTAESAGPIPDASVEKWYARALAEYQTGAAYCQSGVASRSVSQIRTATNDFRRGTAALAHATSAIDAIGGN